MGPVGKFHLCLAALLTAFSLGMSHAYALDPRFELDIKSLREKTSPEKGKDSRKEERVSRSRPAAKESAARPARSGGKIGKRYAAEKTGAPCHALRISPPAGDAKVEARWALDVWDRLIVSGGGETPPLSLEESNFSLTLDPEKYPVLPAADGGKIVLDLEKSLPPLVKSLILEKDPRVRIVAGNESNPREFYRSLFAAAGFYSVEEGFSVSFGSDPKVTVKSDFKIEKSVDSLVGSDVFLVNVPGKGAGMPVSLLSYLENEGFHVVDFSPAPAAVASDGRRTLLSITGGSREAVADAVLEALSVNCRKDQYIELDDGFKSGVILSVKADRYYESNGKKVVFSFSEANPVQFTLLKLLELKGYKVVMLYPEDDFRAISRKVLSVFRLPAIYGTHHLWKPGGAAYEIQLSGFLLKGGERGGTEVLLTDVPLDPLFRELAGFSGYEVIEK